MDTTPEEIRDGPKPTTHRLHHVRPAGIVAPPRRPTLLKPQTGSVVVFGHDIVHDCKAVRRKIGFMPDHFSMYRQMTVTSLRHVPRGAPRPSPQSASARAVSDA